MDQYHEPFEKLDEETRNVARAIRSLIEELDAIDWYHQRMSVTKDEELYEILKHNRDEEVEHAAMALEWLRRKLPVFDDELKDNLFKEGKIAAHHGEEEEDEDDSSSQKSLNVGSMK